MPLNRKNYIYLILVSFALTILFGSLFVFSFLRATSGNPHILEDLEKKYHFSVNFDKNSIQVHPSMKKNIVYYLKDEDLKNQKLTLTGNNTNYYLSSKTSPTTAAEKDNSISNDSAVRLTITETGTVIENNNSSNQEIHLVFPSEFKGQIEFDSTTGDLSIEQINLNQLSFKSISGDISFSNSKIKELKSKTTSGDFIATSTFLEKIDIETINGDILFDLGLPPHGSVKTISGDVKIHLEKRDGTPFSLKSKSGEIYENVSRQSDGKVQNENKNLAQPNNSNPEKLSIETESGDIQIE